MRKTAFAEELLALFMDRARAASVVGDLAEAAGEKGDAWFWRAFAGVLASFAWRPIGGFLLVAAGCWWAPRYFSVGVYGGPDVVPMGIGRDFFIGLVTSLGALSWIIFLFSVIRFGTRDRLTRLSLGFGVVGGVMGWFWWVPVVPALAAISIATMVGSAMWSAAGRRSLAALAGLWLALTAIEFTGLKLYRVGIDHVLGYKNTTTAYVWFLCWYFGVLIIACWLCTRVHRRLIGNSELVRA
ncbi:MAG: hypothetical protein ABSC71_03500 [Candidatus Acidiferrales bacterium]|jgi:hypothetical protein